MKNYVITLLLLISCLGVYAQQPSIEEFKSYCVSMQNNLNIIESNVETIHLMQMEKLSELKKTDYDINSLKQSNQIVFDGFREILQILPEVYAKDTTDNIALVEFKILQDLYNNYYAAIFNKDNAITISDDFRQVIESVTKKINEIREKYEVVESSPEEPSIVNPGKGLSVEIWILLSLVILLLVIITMLILSYNKLRKIQKKCDNLTTDVNECKIIITDIHTKIDELPDASKSNGGQNSTSISQSFGQKDLKNLKNELLTELNNIKAALDLLKLAIKQNFSDSYQDGVSEKEIRGTSHSKETVNSAAIPVRKGLYAQLQGNGSFKTYESDRQNAFYIITPDSTSGNSGRFFLKDLSQETAKDAIDARNSLLSPACEIKETSANPRKIRMDSMGVAEKKGNDWYVKEKATISLID